MKTKTSYFNQVVGEFAETLGLQGLQQSGPNKYTLDIDDREIDCFVNGQTVYLVCHLHQAAEQFSRDSMLSLLQQSVVDLCERREVISLSAEDQLHCWRQFSIDELSPLSIEQYMAEFMDSVELYAQYLASTSPFIRRV